MNTKRIELFLLLLILGSLWGFFEMLALPIYILCAIGILILAMGRRVVDIPGTSILIGLIVCFYKTYSAHFFICQWAGVMALAGSFDFFTSIVFKENWFKKFNHVLVGVLTNFSALIVFVVTVTFIFIEPNWAEGGIDRALSYALRNTLPAAIISGLVSAPLGVFVANKFMNFEFPLSKKLVPGFYLVATVVLWIAASIN
ncbi:MAG: hypothetical protein CO127_08420 [Ignavibacteria bacterium CG_4_9_14_3_um_filter_36_18]|nr:hypothetical protein [Ignavibacteria bacterium]PJB00433.1 MAG: hypothetical protein CO127_08420 [Ignavibacteria bacterium CG_4_9_14_3_um_filter_36_18]